MIDILHHHDHASVLLDGDLEWPRIHELVHAIETAVDHYQYGLVEIRVRSLGGNHDPLNHLLDSLEEYRKHGVRFRTRALGRTSSAAAFLVALGDERFADPNARLLFHGSSVHRQVDLNAAACAALNEQLSKADGRIIARLVDRAIEGPHVKAEHGAESSDREVVEGLCLGATPDPADTAPARLQTLTGALGHTVDNAIAEHDRRSLEHLYARLLQIDRPISGKLARTLALVDRVGHPGAASSNALGNPSFAGSKPTPFASPGGDLPAETLMRHPLVLGDDPGTATRLCLAPLVASLTRTTHDRIGPVLVFDPDPDLRAVLEVVARDRLLLFDPDSLVLDLMPGGHALAPVLEARKWMTAASLIVKRTLALVPQSPARVLLDISGTVVDPVVREGLALVLSVVGFVLMVISSARRRTEPWVPNDAGTQEICRDLLERARGGNGESSANVLALASWLIGVVPGRVPAQGARAAAKAFASWGGEEWEVHEGLADGYKALSWAGDHAQSVVSQAQAILAPFAGPLATRSLHFGLELASDEALDFATLVSGAVDARFLVFESRADGSDRLLANALKHLFCEAVLDAPDRKWGGAQLPLCGLISPNFERFVTNGDQAYLDRAEHAGAFAALTSRSVSAIEHALRGVPGGEGLFSHIWSRVGTKVVLRSTDPRTQELARRLARGRPSLRPDVLDRPIHARRSSPVDSPVDGPAFRTFSMYVHSPGSVRTNAT